MSFMVHTCVQYFLLSLSPSMSQLSAFLINKYEIFTKGKELPTENQFIKILFHIFFLVDDCHLQRSLKCECNIMYFVFCWSDDQIINWIYERNSAFTKFFFTNYSFDAIRLENQFCLMTNSNDRFCFVQIVNRCSSSPVGRCVECLIHWKPVQACIWMDFLLVWLV